MTLSDVEALPGSLAGQQVAVVGRLAGMSRREAARLVRARGGTWLEEPSSALTVVVVGEQEFPLGIDDELEAMVEELIGGGDAENTAAGHVVAPAPELITETQLWQRLGLIEDQGPVRRLYTLAMLAEWLGVSRTVVRRWQRRGLIVPVREVRRLAYFDFQEVATARRLAELLAAGVSPAAIERKLEAVRRLWPGVERPLAQLSLIVEGKELLLRQGEGLLEPGGQRRFDFQPPSEDDDQNGDYSLITQASARRGHPPRQGAPGQVPRPTIDSPPLSGQQMRELAAELEDESRLGEAVEVYRTILAAEGPTAEVNFLLAELLYRQGDLPAARERYYGAVELDEDFVEARANLGCVLAETGQPELAVAALRGALQLHEEYADVHYHLARVLEEEGHAGEAAGHWRRFLELAPESPWADEAKQRVTEGKGK